MTELTNLSDSGVNLVNNGKLFSALEKQGWTKDRFDTIRAQLVQENLILATRGGPGGATALKNARKENALSIFISYCRTDELYKAELVKHLEPLRKLQLVSDWNFRELVPGEKWAEKINEKINSASIIILLVSIDFINSDYCYKDEMETALERAKMGGCVVVPVLLRSCMWQHAPFAKLQGLPKEMRPVASWPDKDEAYVNIVEGIRQTAEEILLQRS